MAQSARDILAGCGLFRSLTDDSLAKIEPIARKVRFAKGRTIFRPGEPCPGIYVVGSGAVRIYNLGPGGKEHVLHFAYPGMSFAEVAAIGQFDCPAYAGAMEDTECVLLPGGAFRQVLQGDHEFCLQLMVGMAGWVRQLVGQLEDLTLRDATSRVAHHLVRADTTRGRERFTLPVRKKDLASHLNLTSETLSRTLRRLADCSLIELADQQHIRILNWEALNGIAQGLPPAEFD